jgi:hypothetical protein
MNKKGDVVDSISFVIVVFILAIGFFIIAFIIPSITNGLSSAGLNNTSEGANAISKLNDFGTQGIQRGFFFVFIGMCIGVLISAYFIDTHPIFLFLYIILLAIAVILAVYLANAYETFSQIDAFSAFYATQGLFTLVVSHIVLITIIVGVLSFIIIFAKFRGKTI